jgi:hypothetical protein
MKMTRPAHAITLLTLFAGMVAHAEDASIDAFATVTEAADPIEFGSAVNGSFGTVFKAGGDNPTCNYFVEPDGSVTSIESGDSGNPISGFSDRTRSGCGFNSTVQAPTIAVTCPNGSLADFTVSATSAGLLGTEFSAQGVTINDTDPGVTIGGDGTRSFDNTCDGAGQTIRVGMRLNILDTFSDLDTEIKVGTIAITANLN